MKLDNSPLRPTEHEARAALERFLGASDFALRPYPGGLRSNVYEATKGDGSRLVLRMGHGDTREHLKGSVHWASQLLPLGIPLPRILHAELSGPLPYTIMSHIDGRHLGDAYRSLGAHGRKKIALQVAQLQGAVSHLPLGVAFGHGLSADDPRLHSTWPAFLESQLVRSRERIAQQGVFNPSVVDRAQRVLQPLEDYLASILPTPFLSDTTLRNVLVGSSGLMGVVGVDSVCFGDPVLVLALTQMSCLASGRSTDYVAHWAHEWSLSTRHRAALDAYTALFCVVAMAGMAMPPNGGSGGAEPTQAKRLEAILRSLAGS